MSGTPRILLEDEHCLALLKPAGQLVQGNWAPPGETTLEQDARRHLHPASPDDAYLGIVHRLDRPVSGILVWAKTPKAARRLSRQFEHRAAIKEYWAVVEAGPDPAPRADGAGLPAPVDAWEDWLTPRTDAEGLVRVVAEGTPGARRARTRVVVDDSATLPDGLRWLRLWPETGRTHQLRVQAAARGTPILGDAHYGATRPFAPGIALHARSLQLRHPATSAPLILVAPTPASWAAWGLERASGPRDA
ncbi:RluA family pseudouridine synthase [Paludisphaera sp.]|uniref:RluA family pseudouridine synthase n=1 Tax=Paludisphaera sp. TaxID=2017432 RepID=UPI00301E5734